MRKTIDYDLSGGDKTFDELVSNAFGYVMLAATATNLTDTVTITPWIGPNDEELIEYADGAFEVAAGASAHGNIMLCGISPGSRIKLRVTTNGATGVINDIQIGE